MKRLVLSLLFVIAGCGHLKVPPAAPVVAPVSEVPVVDVDQIMKSLAARTEKADAIPAIVCPKTGVCVPQYELEGKVDELAADTLISWLDKAKDAGAKDVVLTISSTGGLVEPGFRVVRKLETIGIRSHCVGDVVVASMAAAILQTCSERLMTKRTSIMFHAPLVVAQLSGGEALFRNVAEDLRTSSRAMAEHCVRRMTVSPEEFVAKTTGGSNWFLTWSEAVKVGAVDSVVPDIGSVAEKLRHPK